jgi:hypothetical protein
LYLSNNNLDSFLKNIGGPEATIIQETKMEVYVDKHHIRLRHLYVMPLASTFLDEETMDGCIRKAVEWCEGLPSHDTTHVQKMETYKTTSLSAVLCN